MRINSESRNVANDSKSISGKIEGDTEITQSPLSTTESSHQKLNDSTLNNCDEEEEDTASITCESKSEETDDEEEDIIALAALKGFNVTGIRRRNKSSDKRKHVFEPEMMTEPTNQHLVKIEPLATVDTTNLSTKPSFSDPENIEKESEIAERESDLKDFDNKSDEWNYIRTREEEANRILRARIDFLQCKLEDSDKKFSQTISSLGQAQSRVNFLERELKEQKKLFYSSKTSSDAQIASLNTINRELAAKLSSVEADSLNSSLTRTELDRAKDIITQLQSSIGNINEEKSEFFRQLSLVERENENLRSKSFLVEALSDKCSKMEEVLEESRREFSLQLEKSRAELKSTRAKLESEIAFHRAEHANSVGSSTALHQEISQLKADVVALSAKEYESKLKSEELEIRNAQLLSKVEELEYSEKSNQSIICALENQLSEASDKLSSLTFDCERKSIDLSNIQVSYNEFKVKCDFLQSELNDALVKIQSLESNAEHINSALQAKDIELAALRAQISAPSFEISPNSGSDELHALRDQLAEAEIKISGLQSDLAREIKRADISKRVYEAKLAEFKKI